MIATQGYPVKGGYGHSAVFDKSTKKIFVYGGYISGTFIRQFIFCILYFEVLKTTERNTTFVNCDECDDSTYIRAINIYMSVMRPI